MTLRRFQLGVNVFEIDVRGSELLVGVGKLGRPTLKPRPKASEAEAHAEMERLIAAHLAKGYAEVAIPPDPEIARAFRRRLYANEDARAKRMADHDAETQQALADKLGRAAYEPVRDPTLEVDDPQVYADWLIERGDPRGTIAATFLRGDHAEAERLCAEYTPYGRIRLDHGFAHTAHVGGEPLAVRVRALCGAGVACTVRELSLGLADNGDWTPALEMIATSPIASRVEALTFDASDRLDRKRATHSDDDEDLYRRVAPVRFAGEPAWARLPALERVTIDGPFDGQLGMASTSLRELTIRSLALDDITELLALRKTAPKLRRLGLFVELLPQDAAPALRRALGKRLVTKGDTRPPARYGNVTE